MELNKNILKYGSIFLVLLILFSTIYYSINRIDNYVFIKTYAEYRLYNPSQSFDLYLIMNGDNLNYLYNEFTNNPLVEILTEDGEKILTSGYLTSPRNNGRYVLVSLEINSHFMFAYDKLKFNKIKLYSNNLKGEKTSKIYDIGELVLINEYDSDLDSNINVRVNDQYSDKPYISIGDIITIDSIDEYLETDIVDTMVDGKDYHDLLGKKFGYENLFIDFKVKDKDSLIFLDRKINYTIDNGIDDSGKNSFSLYFDRKLEDVFSNYQENTIKEYLRKVGEF